MFVALTGRAATASAQTTSYSYQKIRVPGSLYTDATGINNDGKVVGSYRDGNGDWHGYMFDENGYTTIDYPGAVETYLIGISPDNKLLGSQAPALGGPYHAFILENGVFTSFDFPGGESDARHINTAGDIVGVYYERANTPTHGFLKSGDTYTSLDYPGATFTTAWRVSDSGMVSGAYADSGGLLHGFVYSGGAYTPFNYPGAVETSLHGGNSAGALVGRYRFGSTFRGFVVKNSSFRSLEVDFPGATFTSPMSMNDTGRLVGTYTASDCAAGCGFLATPQTAVPPQCDQSFTMSYSGTTLTLGFTVRTASPSTWSVLLVIQGSPVSLWNLSVPALTAPASLSVPIPNVPKVGTITGGSLISTATAGVACADIASVNTGTP
jgi:probable HAF family extracellular repeat protein